MIRTLAAALATTTCIVALATPAAAQTREFNIPSGSLRTALDTFARQSGRQVIYRDDVRSARSPGVRGAHTPEDALTAILAGTGFVVRQDRSGALAIVKAGNAPATTDSVVSPGDVDEGRSADIVVTGSRLQGGSPGSPVTNLDRTYIERSTASSVGELIESLPQNFGGFGLQGQTKFNGGANNFSASIAPDLRGLGPQATLTLVNGHRFVPTSLVGGQFVDVSLIPLVALDRVEVLTDTASATYGSDAIAGAVNFELRQGYDGIATSGGVSFADNYTQYNISQIIGTKWSTGSAMIVGDFQANDSLIAADRRYQPNAASLAPDPVSIIPKTDRGSVLISLNQELPSGFSLQAYVLGSRRVTESVSGSTPLYLNHSRFTSDLLTGALDIRKSLGESWVATLSLSGLKSHITNDQRNYYTDVQASFTPDDVDRFDVTGSVSGTLLVADRAVRLAGGGEYEYTKHSEADSFLPVHATRKIASVFGEAAIPLLPEGAGVRGVEQIELYGSVRYDHYSDFGETTNEKLGFNWKVIPGLQFRGSYGTAFRAPPLLDVGGPTTVLHIIGGDPAAPGGVSDQLWLGYANPNLKPEHARGYTLGIDIAPPVPSRPHLSLTYYSYRYRDRINSPGFAGSFLFNPTLYAPYIVLSPTAQQVQDLLASPRTSLTDIAPPLVPANVAAIIDARDQNLSRQVTEGVDLSASGRVFLPGSTLDLALNAAFILKSEVVFVPGSPAVDAVDDFQRPTSLRLRGAATWTKGGFAATAILNHANGYDDTTLSPAAHLGSWTTGDLKLSYTFDEQRGGLLSGLTLGVAAQNIWDAKPPLLPRESDYYAQFGFDTANANAFGRIVRLELSKKW
ncbi:MAG: TonB-dependent receptor [Sphingobium sp.]|nr:TonB-dependent receptor [Sphingobium sp.]